VPIQRLATMAGSRSSTTASYDLASQRKPSGRWSRRLIEASKQDAFIEYPLRTICRTSRRLTTRRRIVMVVEALAKCALPIWHWCWAKHAFHQSCIRLDVTTRQFRKGLNRLYRPEIGTRNNTLNAEFPDELGQATRLLVPLLCQRCFRVLPSRLAVARPVDQHPILPNVSKDAISERGARVRGAGKYCSSWHRAEIRPTRCQAAPEGKSDRP